MIGVLEIEDVGVGANGVKDCSGTAIAIPILFFFFLLTGFFASSFPMVSLIFNSGFAFGVSRDIWTLGYTVLSYVYLTPFFVSSV